MNVVVDLKNFLHNGNGEIRIMINMFLLIPLAKMNMEMFLI